MKEIFVHSRSEKKKGFTLLELLISTAILALLMLVTTGIFVNSFGSYQSTKRIESNISDAQFLMNLLAKELRTSTVVAPSSSGSTQSVKFFEYSRSQCVQYRFNGNAIEVARTASGTSFSSCDNSSNLSGFTPIGSGEVTGSFESVPSRSSSPKRIGRVTITINIKVQSSDPIVIQTTASLRDYGYAGLQ